MTDLTTTRTVCTCGCEYLTTILYKPAFRDAEPKCPCCGGEGKAEEAPTDALIICDHAGGDGCYPLCHHSRPHTHTSKGDWLCREDVCTEIHATVRCVPVADGKEG